MPVPSPDKLVRVREGLTTRPYKNCIVTETIQEAERTGPLVDDLGTIRIMNWKKPMRVATWNVRSLYRSGFAKVLEIELERYGIQIAALQEIRWPEVGRCDLDKGVIYHSGRKDDRHEEGVGFYVSKNVSTAVIEFEGINSRIARMRMNARWFKVTMIVLHAPTEDSEEEVKDQWYDEVQEVLNKVPGHDMLIVLGDMNAKVGKEVAAFRGTIGAHSLHDISNNNGIRLV